jgi:hypothetical protein
MAEEHVNRLTRFDGKATCQAALQAGITAIAGASCKERVAIGVITVLARYLDTAADGLWDAYYLSLDAKAYAKKADELQMTLWRDE